MAYSNPVPGGRLGRTDQGVDVTAPPGTPVYAIADETLGGVIPNWYKGQPFYWFQEKTTGIINFVAEQFSSTLKVGQSVRAGQQIGTVAPSGTGLELGFARNLSAAKGGHPTPGYQEGQPTALGGRYRKQVFGNGSSPRSIVVAASVFGGPRDPSTGSTGYKGDDLRKHPDSFAELSKNPNSLDFSALGNLPYMAPITVTDIATGRSVTLYKRDVGAGGRGVGNHPRAVDIWYQAAQQIGLSGVGLVRVSFGSNAGNTVNSGPGVTRPGGDSTSGGSSSDITQVLSDWTDAQNASGGMDAGSGNQFASFNPLDPLSGIPGVPSILPNPLHFFKSVSGSINSAVDFLKLLAWIINPVNILRMVEFLVGLALMAFGFQAMLQAYGERREGFITSEGALSRSGLGRVSREVASAVSAANPEARAAKAAKGAKGSSGRRRIRPEAAPHRTRRQALRLRYEREKQVSKRRQAARRAGG